MPNGMLLHYKYGVSKTYKMSRLVILFIVRYYEIAQELIHFPTREIRETGRFSVVLKTRYEWGS